MKRRTGIEIWVQATFCLGSLLFVAGSAMGAKVMADPKYGVWMSINALYLLGSAFFFIAACLSIYSLSKAKKTPIRGLETFFYSIGGFLFVIGSILGFFSSQFTSSAVSYLLGSLCYALGSGAVVTLSVGHQFAFH